MISNIIGNLEGLGTLGLENADPSEGPGILNRILSTVIGVMTMVAAIWFLILIITGAYAWMNAGGDKAAIENARNKIINGLIGFTIVIAAIFILDLVGELIGLPFILDPAEFIGNVSP
jgi:uncharacterized membrane protein